MSSDANTDFFKNSPLHTHELSASQVMQKKLATHLRLNTLTLDTMTFAVDAFPPTQIKPSSMVVLVLLNRMSSDIRTAGVLSCLGYTLQAAALIADCHENAFTVLCIGSDDALGNEWINHNDPKKSFSKVKFGNLQDCIRKAYENLKVADVNFETEEEYKTYRTLCLAKHTNPLLQIPHGVQIDNNRMTLFKGPDTSETAIILASFTLEHAAHLAYRALKGFVENHLTTIPETRCKEVREKMEILGYEQSEIRKATIEKYGDTDPFPGKW